MINFSLEPHEQMPAALKAAVDLDETLSDKMVERIICMLANEGLDAVWLGIASADNVDLAMTKGVNYPKGPLAWGAEIGWSRVLKVLENCHDYYGDDRYRPCSYRAGRRVWLLRPAGDARLRPRAP